MYSLQDQRFTREDGNRAVQIAREALDIYVTQDRRVQLGREDDAFITRTGAFVQLRSDQFDRLRGCEGTYDSNPQLADALVSSTVKSAQSGAGGSAITTSELDSLLVSVALVERVIVTDNPTEHLEIGKHIAVVDGGWLYPTLAANQGWTPEQYLNRTYRMAGDAPDAWQRDDTHTVLLEVRVFEEAEPRGVAIEVDPVENAPEADEESPPSFTSF